MYWSHKSKIKAELEQLKSTEAKRMVLDYYLSQAASLKSGSLTMLGSAFGGVLAALLVADPANAPDRYSVWIVIAVLSISYLVCLILSGHIEKASLYELIDFDNAPEKPIENSTPASTKKTHICNAASTT
jgi:hypothetical protein